MHKIAPRLVRSMCNDLIRLVPAAKEPEIVQNMLDLDISQDWRILSKYYDGVNDMA